MQNITVENVDTKDYPDFSDAFISYAEHEDGTPYTDAELDAISSEVVSEAAHESVI